MEDIIVEETIEFNQKLYEKNIQENVFNNLNEQEDGIGGEENGNS